MAAEVGAGGNVLADSETRVTSVDNPKDSYAFTWKSRLCAPGEVA